MIIFLLIVHSISLELHSQNVSTGHIKFYFLLVNRIFSFNFCVVRGKNYTTTKLEWGIQAIIRFEE